MTKNEPRRGYSLIELALAMVIAGIVAAAAISTFSVVNAQVLELRTESHVEAKLQRTLAGLVADLQEVGGGAIRPWHALFVAPGTVASGGSDGVLAFTTDQDFTGDPCPVATFIGSTLTSKAVPAIAPTHCCLTVGSYVHRFGVITKGKDAVIVALDAPSIAPGACTMTAMKLFEPERAAAHDWNDGTLTVVDAKWIAVNHTDHTLNAYMLRYNQPPPLKPGQTPPGMLLALESETKTLARGIYDLQVASGYDRDADGFIDSASAAGDEWFGDAAGEQGTETYIGDDLLEPTTDEYATNKFRMIEVGVIAGLKAKIEANRGGRQVLDGPMYPGADTPRCADDHSKLYLRTGRARVLLRNSGVYE